MQVFCILNDISYNMEEDNLTAADSYIDEEDVNSIVAAFQNSLSALTQECDQLTSENQQLKSLTDSQSETNDILEKELESYRSEREKLLAEYSFKKERADLIESALDKAKSDPNKKAISTRENLLQLAESDQSGVIDLVEELLKEISELQRSSSEVSRQNKQLLDELSSYQSLEAQKTKCKNCKKYYIPLLNKEGECKFHPGKLKFYSCRKCGGDAYFVCCRKCSSCSEGCRVSFHVPY